MDVADLVITDCTALVGEEFVAGATVVVRDGVISSVSAGEPPPAKERIDAHGQVALPGLINCHTHAAMVLFRGAAEDVPAESWFNDHIWPMEANLTPQDVRLGALLACAEMIRAGVTTFADHYFAMDEVADAVIESGLRADLGWAYFSSEGPAGRLRGLDFALRRRDHDRITTSLAPHATYTVEENDLAATAALARENGLRVHVHAAESRDQTRVSRQRHGVTPIEILRRTGVLDAGVLIAHGTGIVPEDLPALAAHADRVGVATAPKGYLKLAWPTTPIRALASAGVAVGLATDGAASNNSLDVWESMMLTGLVQKSVEQDPTWMTGARLLDHATRQSARALGQEGRIGSLQPGHRADLILVDVTGPHVQPVHDLAASLVYSARSSDVRTTIVDGRILMRDRVLLTVDVPALLMELAPRLAALTDKENATRIQTYDT